MNGYGAYCQTLGPTTPCTHYCAVYLRPGRFITVETITPRCMKLGSIPVFSGYRDHFVQSDRSYRALSKPRNDCVGAPGCLLSVVHAIDR